MARNYTEYNGTIEQGPALSLHAFEAGDNYQVRHGRVYCDSGFNCSAPLLLKYKRQTFIQRTLQVDFADYIITQNALVQEELSSPLFAKLCSSTLKTRHVGDTYDRAFDRGLDTSWQVGRGADSVQQIES